MEKNLQIFSLFPDKTCREYGIQQERNIGEAWVGDWKVMKKKSNNISVRWNRNKSWEEHIFKTWSWGTNKGCMNEFMTYRFSLQDQKIENNPNIQE